MDIYIIIAFIAGMVLGLLIGTAVVVLNERKTRAKQKAWNEDFHRRPIEAREDVVVARDPDKPRRKSRVSDAHISQPRDHWS